MPVKNPENHREVFKDMTYFNRTIKLFIALAILCAAPLASISPASAAEEVKISGFTWPGYGFWFIARDKKLAPNLDINYQTIEDPYESYNLVVADQMDVVSSTVEFSPIAAERGRSYCPTATASAPSPRCRHSYNAIIPTCSHPHRQRRPL